uniref:Uncharacterized protein LOC104236137 n=1 Tax=Nicotiana sylvestris TaxID=4096 RepID=A0A1U7XBR5_NICSY|nr:PREDICTED: uncharacterized protein LOC104236137 [Nicotiana sylvestris]
MGTMILAYLVWISLGRIGLQRSRPYGFCSIGSRDCWLTDFVPLVLSCLLVIVAVVCY